MTTDKVHLSDLHFDHRLWLNELRFFEDQLAIFDERLAQVIDRYKDDSEALRSLEAFQNQIIRQREVIDEMKHKFRSREMDLNNIERSVEEPVSANHILFEYHNSEKEEMETFIKLFNEMRENYLGLLSEMLK